MNKNKPEFHITRSNFFPFTMTPIFLLLIITTVLDNVLTLGGKFFCVIALLIAGCFWIFILSAAAGKEILTENINIVRYIYAKIKYMFFRYILGKKSYKFKYEKYSRIGDIFDNFKDKKEKEKIFPARQFLRHYIINTTKPIFANKFCIVCINYEKNQISYFDKLSGQGYQNNKKQYPIDDNILKNIFNQLCKTFDFDTKIDNVIEIIKSYLYLSFQNINQPVDYDVVSLNSMSVAELLSLPGMNLGKANKIYSYLKKKKPFKDVNEFILSAEINEKDAQKIKKIFGNNCTCSIKKLNEINAADE